MYQIRNITSGFVIVILLLVATGVTGIVSLTNMASDIDSIYRHPLAVSNAAKNIRIHFVSMHRSMKDVVLAENNEVLTAAVDAVDNHEQAVFQEFGLIFERFLGDKAQIQKVYRDFVTWKGIRDRVIALVRAGDRDGAAAITKGQGAEHVALLTKGVTGLSDFALAKAEALHQNSQRSKRSSLILMAGLGMLALSGSVATAIIVITDMRAKQRQMAERAHLIDQNIHFASLDLQGRVLEASNALCRLIGTSKKDFIGSQSNFLLQEGEGNFTRAEILSVVETGEAFQDTIRHIDRHGHVKWISLLVRPVFDSQFAICGYNLIVKDVTDHKESITDALTSLYNRRHFDEIIDKEIRQSSRTGTNLTLAVLDIDFFKRYNDKYGHPQGDIALSRLAACLKESLGRPNDYVFRLGGEEFAILFSGADVAQSYRLLDQIRQNVEDLHILHEYSDVGNYMSISIGAYNCEPSRVMDKEEFYKRADAALYKAKETRNCVVMPQQNRLPPKPGRTLQEVKSA